MIPVRVSFWYEFIPVLTYRSVFVYMIPVENLIPVQLVPVRDFTCKHPLSAENKSLSRSLLHIFSSIQQWWFSLMASSLRLHDPEVFS